jgi:hypothetical protein
MKGTLPSSVIVKAEESQLKVRCHIASNVIFCRFSLCALPTFIALLWYYTKRACTLHGEERAWRGAVEDAWRGGNDRVSLIHADAG